MAINKNVLAEKQATVLSEDGNTMYATIQMRHGKESEMDKSKFVPAEIGVTTDTKKAFMAFSPGNVKEMMFREDSEIEELLGEVRKISDQAVEAVESAEATAKQTIEDYTEQMKATIPEDYTEMVKKVDILERTKAPAIHQTATGNPITLTDAAEGTPVVDFAMDGKTEQVQTTGAQLIEYPYLNDSQTINGVMFSVLNQGEIRVQGEATQTVNFPLYSFNYKNGKSYYISGCPKGGSSGTYNIRTENGRAIDTGDGITYSPNEDGSTNININIQTGTKVNGLIFKPMLNSGSEALPWEPYTGGQPSPSPDYPQEIVNGGNYNEESQKWEYEVKVQGKNLIPFPYLDSDKTQNGLTFTIQEDGGVKVNGTATATTFFNFCKIHFGDSNMTPSRPSNGEYVISGSVEGANVQYDINNDYTYITISNGTTVNNQIIYPQVEYGTEPTPYEKYRSQTVLLQSDRPLTKWDKLYKRDGQWGWVFNSNNIVFDGSEDENWMKHSNNRFYIAISDKIGSGLNGEKNYLCNKLTPFNTNIEVIHMPNNTIKESGMLGQKNMYLHIDEAGNDVESFKTWLQSNSLLIWYKTAEETFVPLTTPEQSALEALTTYFPTTIITVEDGELSPEIKIEYVADTKTYIDNKFAELAQNLAATQNTLLEV